MFEKTDEQLIQRAIAGNQRAWSKLVRRYQARLYNYAWRMCGNGDDAMDLLQDIFISVFRNLPGYRQQGSFEGWLYRIAHRRCVEFFRRRKPTDSLQGEAEQVCSGDGPARRHEVSSTQHKLLQSLQHLPLEQRLVVELKFFNQLTFDDIAAQLNISSNTAKSRLYAGLSKLKGLWETDHA